MWGMSASGRGHSFRVPPPPLASAAAETCRAQMRGAIAVLYGLLSACYLPVAWVVRLPAACLAAPPLCTGWQSAVHLSRPVLPVHNSCRLLLPGPSGH